ncbi:MAG: SprT family zinc-dependent metalloprotease [Clostridia bacterium]|nr:SprT family zinc-dependent metalloprotease [Clostridia bacterium]
MKTEIISIGGKPYNVTFVPGKRKSISMRMTSSDCLEVRYPSQLGKGRAVEFIESKSRWLENKSRLFNTAEKSGAGTGIYEGRSLYYLGSEYMVEFGGDEIRVSEGSIIIPEGCKTECMEEWYKSRTQTAVREFINKYGHGLPEFTIKVKKQKKRWGSCTSQKRIYINSKLSMCPPGVIEYIIWHEVCHLAHMNHSKDFYRLLAVKCPDYKKHRAWLKKHHLLLQM